jgi:very-short-patch-repair endonuclease
MKSYAQDLRNNATEPERLLWSRLRRRQLGGFKFRRQHPIGRYVCDFVCREASMIIELDGSQHLVDALYDANRDAFLRSAGFRVLRFWNGDVLSQTDSVVETIYEALYRPGMEGRFD